MIMTDFIPRLMIGIVFYSLAACATVEDVTQASDLIATDNELTRLLAELRPDDQAGASSELAGLAATAQYQADALRDTPAKADAIAYYRIAATAYWRSGNPDVTTDLFASTNAGNQLCTELGSEAPERDCLYLQLIIPFAGVETKAASDGVAELLDSVDFNDGDASSGDIENMNAVRDSLAATKPALEKILAMGSDESLQNHQSMQTYYCDNTQKMVNDYFVPNASLLATKVREFKNVPEPRQDLGFSLDDARKLKKLSPSMPAFCLTE